MRRWISTVMQDIGLEDEAADRVLFWFTLLGGIFACFVFGIVLSWK